MSKYGDLIKKAREPEPENQITRNPENQISGLVEPEPLKEQFVNLCIKIPIQARRYWMSKAKEQGVTMTAVIVEALTEKFGEPENQITRKP
ncbi:MAG: hypothetical protein H0X31_00585 [Nostocaceae cyanobacterium]|nr:hypothetical protein [Nostocaceae cyanobacterium]